MTDDKRHYRTEIPNIIDDLGLDPHERALYVHYKRACGGNDCEWVESVRITAQRTKMSVGRASEARKSLVERGLIRLIPKGNDGTAVRIVNIWDLNTIFYSQDYRPDVDGWSVKQLSEWCQGVHNMNTLDSKCSDSEALEPGVHNMKASVHIMNNKKEPLEDTLPKGKGGKPPTIDKPKKKSQPTEIQLEARAMFATLADVCKYDLAIITEKEKGELNQAEKKMRDNGYKPDDLKGFESWWYTYDWRGRQNQPPKLSQIRETWGQYKAHLSGNNGASPRGQPPAQSSEPSPVSAAFYAKSRKH